MSYEICALRGKETLNYIRNITIHTMGEAHTMSKEILIWENPPGQWNHQTWDGPLGMDQALITNWHGPTDCLYWNRSSGSWYCNAIPEPEGGGFYDITSEEAFFSRPDHEVPSEVRALALLLG